MKEEMLGHFRHNAFFLGANTRKEINNGKGDYLPVFLSQLPSLLRSNPKHKINVVFIQVSPPDSHGFCSLGVAVDCTRAAMDSANYIIAQVNRNMPRVSGDSFVHLSEIDLLVEEDMEIPELNDNSTGKSEEDSAVFRQIGENIAELLKTVQRSRWV